MLNLPEAPLIGEGGCLFWRRGQMPTSVWRAPIRPEAVAVLEWARRELLCRFGERLFLQPNEVAVAAFSTEGDERLLDEVEGFLQESGVTSALQLLRHADSVELIPRGVDKGLAVRQLAAELNVPLDRVIGVGDGVNDAALLATAGVAIRVGDDPALTNIGARRAESFSDLPEMLPELATAATAGSLPEQA